MLVGRHVLKTIECLNSKVRLTGSHSVKIDLKNKVV